MAKILKNSTGLDIDIKDTGITVPALGQYTIQDEDYTLWSFSDDIQTTISSGDIIINDGVNDLSITDGSNYIKYPDRAFRMRFESEPERSNAFAAKNVQDAIEEGRISAIGTLLQYNFTSEDSNVKNKWLYTTDHSGPSNEVPYIIPQGSEIKGIEFSNRDDSSSTDIEVYINGIFSFVVQVRDKRYFWKLGATLATVNQGDRISIFLRKVGVGSSAPNKPLILLLAKIITEVAGESGEEFGD